MRQETAFFDRTRTGELINRLSADTILVGKAVTDNVSDGLRAVAQSVAGVSMMVSLIVKQFKLTVQCFGHNTYTILSIKI